MAQDSENVLKFPSQSPVLGDPHFFEYYLQVNPVEGYRTCLAKVVEIFSNVLEDPDFSLTDGNEFPDLVLQGASLHIEMARRCLANARGHETSEETPHG